VQLCEPDEARVGEGHGTVGVLAQEPSHRSTLDHDIEVYLQKVAQQEVDEAIDPLAHTSNEMSDLGEHRLARQERRLELPQAIDGPAVMIVGPYQQRDERPGIDDDLTHRSLPCAGRGARDRAAPTGVRRGA